MQTQKSDQSHAKGKALFLWSPTSSSGLRRKAVITSGSSAEQIQHFHRVGRVAWSLYCLHALKGNAIKTGFKVCVPALEGI